jgi:RNA polymerase-associated protein LEO1
VQDTQQDAFEEQEQQTLNFMDADMARHAIPEPSDGELYLLKVPRFLSIEPTAWDHKTFEAPKVDHHNKEEKASEHFSAYNTAMTTVRWRRSPTNPAELQSNARVLRWSDGSLTLQFASEPANQYEINSSMLAPPQIAPKIPTPTSIFSKSKGAEYKESYTYLVAPYEEANVMRVTNKFTTGLFVVPTANSKDDALAKLQSDLAAAASRGRGEADEAISFIRVDEDPELQRAREEATFKEKQRQIKAREKNELRERERASRTLGRTGARSSGYGGLSIGGLEDDEGGRRAGAPKRKPKTGLRRDWSDDEDYGIRGKTREDDYDEEDGFIVRSDEEPEFEEDSDQEEILDSPPRRGGDASPKRKSGGGRAAEDSDDEVVVSRTKRRRVVEDDDDEDE